MSGNSKLVIILGSMELCLKEAIAFCFLMQNGTDQEYQRAYGLCEMLAFDGTLELLRF